MVNLIARGACDGLPVRHGPFTLREDTPGVITSLAPFRGQRAGLSKALRAAHGVGFPAPNCAAQSETATCLWTGRDQAFLLGPDPDSALNAFAAITDQSDAWAAVILGGRGAEDVLARLVPVDLRAPQFGPSSAMRTQLGHMSVSLSRTADGIRIMAFRSMAATLIHELTDAMEAVAARQSEG